MLGTQDSVNATIPFNKEKVFDSVLIVAQKMKGFKVKDSDKLLGRIVLSTSASATSWGEAIPIQLTEIEEGKTLIAIVSKSKTGVLAGGAITKRNEQNVEVLIKNISNHLQGKDIKSKAGSQKSLTVTLLLCILLGWMGAHRYYVGKTGTGVLYTLTCGVFFIGILIDVLRIFFGNFTDKDGEYVTNW